MPIPSGFWSRRGPNMIHRAGIGGCVADAARYWLTATARSVRERLQVFLCMLSLILRKALEARMRASGLLKKYSVDALIAEIEKNSVIKLTYGDDILMEITKKQRDIFTKLGISLPQIT